jgi:multiple sugar transport system ATP-binding protein
MVAAAQGIPGMTFSAVIDVLAADAGSDDVPGAGEQIVARLDPASRAREGQKLELWFDPRKVHLFNPETFNPETGAHITL